MQASDFAPRLSSVVHVRWTDVEFALAGWSRTAICSTDPAVRIVRSQASLLEVGRLRYGVSVARGGQRCDDASDDKQVVVEPIDRASLVFAAGQDRTLATVRLSRAADAMADPHLARLVACADPADVASSVVFSRLAVMPQPSARRLIVPMFLQAYRSAHLCGATQGFTAARNDLISILSRFGWRPTGQSYSDPAEGQLQLLRYDRLDIALLRRANSPLLSVAADLFGSPSEAIR